MDIIVFNRQPFNKSLRRSSLRSISDSEFYVRVLSVETWIGQVEVDFSPERASKTSKTRHVSTR